MSPPARRSDARGCPSPVDPVPQSSPDAEAASWFPQVGVMEADLDAGLPRQQRASRLDGRGIAEAGQHHLGALPGNRVASPSPMPLVEPVTNATFPWSMGSC